MSEKIKRLPVPFLHASIVFVPSLIGFKLLQTDAEIAAGLYYLACALAGYGTAMTGNRFKKSHPNWIILNIRKRLELEKVNHAAFLF